MGKRQIRRGRFGPGRQRFCLAIPLFTLAALVAPGLAQAFPGQLDTGFGVGGRVVQPAVSAPTFGSEGPSGAGRPDGGAVVLLGKTLFSYLPDGKPDLAFGGTGQVEVAAPKGIVGFSVRAVAVDAVGRTVIAGGAALPPVPTLVAPKPGVLVVGRTSGVVERYLPDGRLDPSFGEGGVLISDFGLPAPTQGELDFVEGPGVNFEEVAVDHAGRIVATGTRLDYITRDHIGGPHWRTEPVVVRLDTGGTPDPTFGGAGVSRLGMIGEVRSAALDSGDGVFVRVDNPNLPFQYRFFLAHLDANGGLDPGFGIGGWRRLSTKTLTPGGAFAVDTADRLLIPGTRSRFVRDDGGARRAQRSTVVQRLRPGGGRDRGFGRNGFVTIPQKRKPVAITAVTVDSAGRPLLAGSWALPIVTRAELPRQHFALIRISAGGVDRGFGRRGVVTTGFGLDAHAVPSTIWSSGETTTLLGLDRDWTLPGGTGFAISRYATGK